MRHVHYTCAYKVCMYAMKDIGRHLWKTKLKCTWRENCALQNWCFLTRSMVYALPAFAGSRSCVDVTVVTTVMELTKRCSKPHAVWLANITKAATEQLLRCPWPESTIAYDNIYNTVVYMCWRHCTVGERRLGRYFRQTVFEDACMFDFFHNLIVS